MCKHCFLTDAFCLFLVTCPRMHNHTFFFFFPPEKAKPQSRICHSPPHKMSISPLVIYAFLATYFFLPLSNKGFLNCLFFSTERGNEFCTKFDLLLCQNGLKFLQARLTLLSLTIDLWSVEISCDSDKPFKKYY